MGVAGLRVDDQLPKALVDDRVEEGQVVEAHRPAQHVLENVPVQEHRAEFVLQQAETDDAARGVWISYFVHRDMVKGDCRRCFLHS